MFDDHCPRAWASAWPQFAEVRRIATEIPASDGMVYVHTCPVAAEDQKWEQWLASLPSTNHVRMISAHYKYIETKVMARRRRK